MKTRIGASLFVAILFAAVTVTGASAQSQRTFVSGLGRDSNPCSSTAPCRTFTQALAGTAAGGEVVVLASAGYGAFSITRAVSIIAAPGVFAGVSVSSGDGIDISVGLSDTVILRGLTINNQGSSGNGIVFNSHGNLQVEGCVVSGFSNGNGILVEAPLGIAKATIDQVRLEGNGAGLLVRDGSFVTVSNSLSSYSTTGFGAFSSRNLSQAELNIENCVAFGNANGIKAQATSTGFATVRVSNSTVTEGVFGLLNSGLASLSFLLSRGNNTVEGNFFDTSGMIGSYTAK